MQVSSETEVCRQFGAGDVLKSALEYVQNNKKTMLVFLLFSVVIALFSAGFGGVASWGFWPVFASFYILESIFFRFYFDKVPYFCSRPLLVSLVPSIKVIFITVAFLWLFSMLPFVPLLLGMPYLEEYSNSLQYVDGYVEFLQVYMQDIPLIDVAISGVLLLISPFMLFRPFLAWVAAIMGRRGSLRLAWKKSRGNYFSFVCLGLFLFLPVIVLYHVGGNVVGLKLICDLLMIPFVLFFNVVMAQLYGIFYAETI